MPPPKDIMETEPIINETESLDFNESWLNPPSTLTSEDFPEVQSFGGNGGDEPEYRNY